MNKVIIFGEDHHNSLGLARVFGINGIKPDGVLTVIATRFVAFSSKSKYWNHVTLVSNAEEGLKKIIELYSKEKEKPVLIPSSDKAELVIDENKRILEECFFVPGFLNNNLSVKELMDKSVQAKWANNLSLNIAPTWVLSLNVSDITNEVTKVKKYPCILKPVMSSEGDKKDIVKCNDSNELIAELQKLKEKGYNRILAQEFLFKEYEMELFGCILKNSERVPFFLTKHLREWPIVGGTVSCHEFIVDEELKQKAEDILKRIRAFGYCGNIDIELFKIGKDLYLNEVNFRNSGDVYACFHNKVFYPYIWFLDSIGKDVDSLNIGYSNDKYAMNEVTDFRHVIRGNIKLTEWLRYYRNSGDFAVRFRGDMKPYYALHWHYLLSIIKGKKI